MLEGPDLAGKTTLANAMLKLLKGGEIVHRGPPAQSDPFLEYLKPLEEMYYEGRWPILDRWHWGELIYGPILRGSSMMDAVQHEYIEMACMRYGVSRLLLIPTMSELRQRFEARGDDLVNLEQLFRVADAYQHLSIDPDYSIHHVLDGPQNERWERPELARLIAEAMGYRVRANMLMNHPSYIGPTRPQVLFVGEKPAESHLGRHKTAFVPYRGTSGHHLLSCLRAVQFRDHVRVGPPWREFGMVNAYDGTDLKSLMLVLDRPESVVALGVKAHEALNFAGIAHGRAPHPQFARRFHNKKRESYGQALLAAVDGRDMSKWKG